MKKANTSLRRLRDCYRFAALTTVNTLVALLVLNLLAWAAFALKDYFSGDPVSAKYGFAAIEDVYPGLDADEINELLTETWSRPYAYRPFTQFMEQPFQGRFVNVDKAGFRLTRNQGPWPPDGRSVSIFLFGGSTTFGYGVADDQTIASHLQEALSTKLESEVYVYNFGQGSYFSTQERIQFQELITAGFEPDFAVFIDGLNDFYHASGEPLLTDKLRRFVAHQSPGIEYRGIFAGTSLGRAAAAIKNRFAPHSFAEAKLQFQNAEVVESVINRYLANKRIVESIASSSGVTAAFVWQPVPMYNYDRKYHPFSEEGLGNHMYSGTGYQQMAQLHLDGVPGDNFLWCADMQKDAERPLYVDQVHYSAAFSEELAIVIAEFLTTKYAVQFNAEK